jgi:hypothetical protein
MSKWNESPAIRINDFVTASLRAEGIIPPLNQYVTQTNNQSPQQLPFMIPAAQIPELETMYNNGFVELPYCVYTISHRTEKDAPWCYKGQTTWHFYSSDTDKLIEIENYVNDLCKREDWSAADCNDYFSKNDPTNPFNFQCITFLTSVGPAATDDEGGRYMSLVIIRHDSTYEGTGRVGVEPFSGGLGMIH